MSDMTDFRGHPAPAGRDDPGTLEAVSCARHPDDGARLLGRRRAKRRHSGGRDLCRLAILCRSIFRALFVWHARHAPGFVWSLLTAVLSVVLGLILVLRPLAGVLTLTMVLIAFFIVEGVASIIGAFQHRDHLRSWGWVLFSGIIDLVLAFLIWDGWPSSADWAIGLLVGINMLFFGLSLVMTSLTARLMGNQLR